MPSAGLPARGLQAPVAQMAAAKGFWPCAECYEVQYNRKMILSTRPQQMQPPAAPEDRPRARKICVGCELNLRRQEATARGVPCEDSVEAIRLDIISNNSSDKQTIRMYAYKESVAYVKRIHAEDPQLTSKQLRDMRVEHAAFVLTKLLQAGRLFEAFSRAAETMAAISKVRDRTDALQKEAEECKRRGNTERLQQLIIELEALEEEEELIAWGDF